MSILEQVIHDLEDIERKLGDRPELAQRLHAIGALLSNDEAQWVSILEATRLLGAQSEETIHTWVRLGLLHTRVSLPDQIDINLVDLLREKEAYEVLGAVAAEESQWISASEAQALLRVHSEETIGTWARLGLLRSRSEDGQLQVRRDDVLRQREKDRDLEGDGDDRPITSEEYHSLRSHRLATLTADRRAALEEVIAEARQLART